MSLEDLTNTVSIETGANIILYESLKEKIVYLRVSKVIESKKLLEYYKYLLDANGLSFNKKNGFYTVTPVTDLNYFEYKFKNQKTEDFKSHIENFKNSCSLSSNLLFCYAVPETIERIKKMVKIFDTPKKINPYLHNNIEVDLTILESNYNDVLELKSSLALSSSSHTVSSSLNSNNALSLALGFLFGGSSVTDFSSLSYAFDLLQQKGISTVSNNPNLIITNGFESSIITGGTQRVISTETTNDDLSASTKTYEELTTGLQLTVKAEILDDEKILLTLSLLNDDVVGGTNELPITSKQSYKTTMVVKKDEALILGGVIYDKTSLTRYKVPFLGDIPFIGVPFNGKSEDETRKILAIALHIKDFK